MTAGYLLSRPTSKQECRSHLCGMDCHSQIIVPQKETLLLLLLLLLKFSNTYKYAHWIFFHIYFFDSPIILIGRGDTFVRGVQHFEIFSVQKKI